MKKKTKQLQKQILEIIVNVENFEDRSVIDKIMALVEKHGNKRYEEGARNQAVLDVKAIRQENKKAVKRYLARIVKKNTDDKFGTCDFDGIAEDVLKRVKK